MKNSESLFINNVDLYALFADNEMSDEQFNEIKALLKDSEAARNHYYRMVNLEVLLRDSKGIGQALSDGSAPDFWHALAQHEKTAPAVEVEEPEEVVEWQPIQKIKYERPARTINRFSLGTAIVSAAALLLMILYVRFAPPLATRVATVTDSIDAKWSSDLPIEPGTRMLSSSRPIQLTRGTVEFETDEQVRVVLEAPAEFYFSSYTQVAMNYGKLFAHVSKQGAGFSVQTQNSKIVDLGTEFGVISHIDGGTEVHLYKGKANLLAGQKQEPKTSQLLTAGSARSIDPGSCEVQAIALDQHTLARAIDSDSGFVWRGQKTLRLTDLLLGGRGFGTATTQSIDYDLATDRTAYGTDVPSKADIPQGSYADVRFATARDAGYRQGPSVRVDVPQSPYLDSVFVPPASRADLAISSAGHRFEGCPETSGLYFSNIVCQKDGTFFEPVQQDFEQSVKQFTDSSFLYMHSNLGVTIDLDAVRSQVPGCRLASFSAFAGILDILNNDKALDYAEVDVWVLVDGQLRSSRQALRADQGYDIHVDLADADRFLTLVVTDGGTPYLDESIANHFDSCGFAEPVFQLVSQDKDR
jgi:hypothetical protein